MTSKIFVFLITAALASNVVKIFVDINDDSNNDAHDSDGVKNDVAKNYAFVDDAENDANDVAKMVDATNDDDRFENNADDVAETDVSEDDEKDDPIDGEDQQHVAGTWKELAKEVYREDIKQKCLEVWFSVPMTLAACKSQCLQWGVRYCYYPGSSCCCCTQCDSCFPVPICKF